MALTSCLGLRASNVISSVKRIMLSGSRSGSFPAGFRKSTNRSNSETPAVVRSATEKDMDGIIQLSRVSLKDDYRVDYLPGWLPQIFRDPNRLSCVAERGDTIIAFVSGLYGVDNGRVFLGGSGRVDPNAGGSGLITRCMAYLVAQAVHVCPQYEAFRGSTLLTKFIENNLDKVQLLNTRNYIEIHLPSERLCDQPSQSLTVPVSLRIISSEELVNLLDTRTSNRHLFPEGVMSAGYDVFELMSSNVRFVTSNHPNLILGDDNRSLSIGGVSACNDNRSWRYSFNYSGRVDLNTCMAHLTEHLKLCGSGQDGRDLYLLLFIPKSFQNLFGKDAIGLAFAELLGIPHGRIIVRIQYQYEFI